MAENTVLIRIKAIDDATSTLNRVSADLKKFQTTARTLASAGAIAGVTAIGAALSFSVKAAQDAEKVQAQLKAVLESTGGAAGVTAQQALDLAAALQKVTPFSDEVVLSAENMLLTFTNIKDVFPQATELVLDMATALGEDTKEAAIQLGKALQDPINGVTALRRVGVQLSDAQKDQVEQFVKTGDVLSAQKVILEELTKEFGNSARAAGKTFGGQMAILRNSIDDVAEAIGNALIPHLTEAASALSEFLQAHQADIQRFVDGFANALPGALEVSAQSLRDIGTAGQSAADGLGSIVGITDDVTAAAAPLAIAFAFLFPQGALVAGILAVHETFTILDDDVDTASDSALQFESAWLGAIAAVLEKLADLEDGLLAISTLGLSTVFDFGDTAAQKALDAVNKKRREIGAEQLDREGIPVDLLQKIAFDPTAFNEWIAATDESGRTAGHAAPYIFNAGDGMEAAGKSANILSDGIISLDEALANGLSDAQVVALELSAASNKQAKADFRRRIELQTLAAVFPNLTSQEVEFRLGLAAIADHLQLTGQTIEQFILDTSTAALEGFKSAFDAIFNKPTKESAALQLQLDEAKRRKLLNPGASESQKERFDADIQRIQDLINVRSNAVDILKDKALLADQTLLSDADALNQAGLQIAAIGQESVRTAQAIGEVFLKTLQQMNGGPTAAPALSLQDALIALSGLPDHGQSLLPSFAVGSSFVPRDMTARIHRGERIIPAGESGQPINVTSYITITGDATENTVALIKKAVRDESEAALRRASFRGSYVTSGAYTPS